MVRIMILISPSKTQDFLSPAPTFSGVKSPFLKEVGILHAELKKYSSFELSSLMNISEKLGQLNFSRFQKWSSSFRLQKTDMEGELNFKQALFAFRGDVYTAFEKHELSESELSYAENNLRIISGFYGLLTPLTFIKPYRLEMKTRLKFSCKGQEYKNLYEFWSRLLTTKVIAELKDDEIILNLASKEYSKVIDFSVIDNQKIDVKFLDMKDGESKIIAVYAKLQRGEMALWAIRNRVEDVKVLKKYKNDGYKYNAALSDGNTLAFLRG